MTPSLRVVLDPNVLVSGAITPRGAGARILALIDSGDLVSIASPQLVAELSAVLRRPKFRRYLASIFHDGPDRGLSAPVASMLV